MAFLRAADCWEQQSGLHKGYYGLSACFAFVFFWRRWEVAVQAQGTPQRLTSTPESAPHAHLPLKAPSRDGGESYRQGRKGIPNNRTSVHMTPFHRKSNKTYFGHGSLLILPRVHPLYLQGSSKKVNKLQLVWGRSLGRRSSPPGP